MLIMIIIAAHALLSRSQNMLADSCSLACACISPCECASANDCACTCGHGHGIYQQLRSSSRLQYPAAATCACVCMCKMYAWAICGAGTGACNLHVHVLASRKRHLHPISPIYVRSQTVLKRLSDAHQQRDGVRGHRRVCGWYTHMWHTPVNKHNVLQHCRILHMCV